LKNLKSWILNSCTLSIIIAKVNETQSMTDKKSEECLIQHEQITKGSYATLREGVTRMQNFGLYLSVTIILATLNGWASSIAHANEENFQNNENKAYVVFAREVNLLGAARTPTIYEFDPNTYAPKLVGSLSIGDKIAWEIDEGLHYFFTDYINSSINKIQAKKGVTYYVSINEIRLIPEISKSKYIFEKYLSSMTCSDKIINQYLFTEIAQPGGEDDDEVTESANKSRYYSSPALTNSIIKCNDKKISILQSGILASLDDVLRTTKFFKKNNEDIKNISSNNEQLKEQIKEFYDLYRLKYEGIPIWGESYLNIITPITPIDYKNFSGISISEIKSFATENNVENFKNNIKSIEKSGSNPISLKVNILKYTEGSQVGRYAALAPFSIDENSAVIHAQVDFVNNKGVLVSSIQISNVITGGMFGGTNSLENDLQAIIKEYTERNLLK